MDSVNCTGGIISFLTPTDLSDAEAFYLLGDLFEQEGIISVPVNHKYRAGKADMQQSFLVHVKV